MACVGAGKHASGLHGGLLGVYRVREPLGGGDAL